MTKKKILIIDDDPIAAALLRANLEKVSLYEIRTESSGKLGLAAAKEFRPDLILLDVVMPEMDGGAVASHLEADRKLRHIPIIFLTSLVSEEESGILHLLSGRYRFMGKPVQIEQLLELIEETIEEPHVGVGKLR